MIFQNILRLGTEVGWKLRLLLTMALAILSCSTSVLANPPDGSAIPADQWEMHGDAGIALYMALYTETTQDNKQVNHLLVFIKNISATPQDYPLFGRYEGLRFFYTDDKGVQNDLRPPPAFISVTGVFDDKIIPGAILKKEIKLNPTELTFVTSHPIQCSFLMYDPTTKQGHTITSQPKTLTF